MRGNVVLHGGRSQRAHQRESALVRQAPVPLPHDTNAERVILSGALKEWEWLKPLMGSKGITEASFYHWHHRLIWRSLPNPFMRISRRAWPNLAQWIAELWYVDPTGCSAEYAAFLVRGCEVRREIIVRARELIRDAYDRVHSPSQYSDMLRRLT